MFYPLQQKRQYIPLDGFNQSTKSINTLLLHGNIFYERCKTIGHRGTLYTGESVGRSDGVCLI